MSDDERVEWRAGTKALLDAVMSSWKRHEAETTGLVLLAHLAISRAERIATLPTN